MPETIEQNEFVIEESLLNQNEIINPLGDVTFPAKNKTEEIPPMASYPVQRSNKASVISKIYGTVRVAGNVIWMGPNHPWQQSESAGGKGGGGGETVTNSGNRRSFLIGICEGPAIVLRVWKGKEEITFNQITVFRGDGLVDTGIENLIGEDFANYPNTCCVYFDEFEIGSNTQVPNFTFEVTDQFDPTKTQITNAQGLQDINNDLSGDYELLSDIDLEGFDWSPIGPTAGTPFSGTFDGRFHTISNLSLTTTTNSIGLFGNTNGATIEKVLLSNFEIHGDNGIGCLLGTAINTDLTFIGATGDIYIDQNPSFGGNFVGGLLGGMTTSGSRLFQKCWAAVTIHFNISGFADSGLGGLIGNPGTTDVEDCWAGGSFIKIANPGRNYAQESGGFMGQATGQASGNPKRCHSYTGRVYSSGTQAKDKLIGGRIGGFIGRWSFANPTDCHWDTDISTLTWGANGVGPPADAPITGLAGHVTSVSQQQATYTNWDFDTVWIMSPTTGYPVLRWAENALPSDENPAVIIKDLLTNTRYGGNIDEATYINAASFTEVEEYCDANGLRFSFVIGSQKPVLDWVSVILDHFFGYLFMSQGKLHLGIYKEEN